MTELPKGPRAVHRLVAADLVIGSPQIQPAQPVRRRKVRIDKMIAEAEAAGKNVTGVTANGEGVTLTFGTAERDGEARDARLVARERIERMRVVHGG